MGYNFELMAKLPTPSSRPRKHANADLQVGEAFYGGVLSKLLFGMATGKKTSLALLTAYSDKRALYEVEGDRRKVHLLLKYVAKPRHGKKGVSWTFNLSAREIGWIFNGLAPCASHIALAGTPLTESRVREIADTLGYTSQDSLSEEDDEATSPVAEVREETTPDEEEIEDYKESTSERHSFWKGMEECSNIFLGLIGGHASSPSLKGVHSTDPTPICLLGPVQLRELIVHILATHGPKVPPTLRMNLTVRVSTRAKNAKMEVVLDRRKRMTVPRNALLKLAQLL